MMQRNNSQEETLCNESFDHSGEGRMYMEESSVGCPGSGPSFFDWREIYPELQLLIDEYDTILEESRTVSTWLPWPEEHFAKNGVTNWTVFPFVHTFPALDESKKTWVSSTCAHCPKTTAILKQLPNLKTALFSRLGGGVTISPHTGWADLANHVLRCHLALTVPQGQKCGLWVNACEQYHAEREIIVFDDSKIHKAFNVSTQDMDDANDGVQMEGGARGPEECLDRVVLIVDLLRPSHIPLGAATGSHTAELDDFISAFR